MLAIKQLVPTKTTETDPLGLQQSSHFFSNNLLLELTNHWKIISCMTESVERHLANTIENNTFK